MRTVKCGWFDGPAGRGSDLLAAAGPTLLVDIGFDPNWRPSGPSRPPHPAIRSVQALVDTGAAESCIDNALAGQLGLPIIDRRQIAGIGGRMEVDVYPGQIHVPALAFTIYGAFASVNLIAGGQQHLALIGRTFLRHFAMIYNGLTGDVELTVP